MKPLNGQIHHQYIWTLVNTLALSSSYYPFLKGTGLDQKELFWLLSQCGLFSLAGRSSETRVEGFCGLSCYSFFLRSEL